MCVPYLANKQQPFEREKKVRHYSYFLDWIKKVTRAGWRSVSDPKNGPGGGAAASSSSSLIRRIWGLSTLCFFLRRLFMRTEEETRQQQKCLAITTGTNMCIHIASIHVCLNIYIPAGFIYVEILTRSRQGHPAIYIPASWWMELFFFFFFSSRGARREVSAEPRRKGKKKKKTRRRWIHYNNITHKNCVASILFGLVAPGVFFHYWNGALSINIWTVSLYYYSSYLYGAQEFS